MTGSFTIIDTTPGEWRSAEIGDDSLPKSLRFHSDTTISPLDAVFDARVTRVDKTLDMAFLDLGAGLTGSLNFRRARLHATGQAQSIADCVTEGERLRVQVVSEPSTFEDKALTVTPRPRLMGRYVVAECGKPRVSLSKDIPPKKTKDLQAALSPITLGCVIIIRSRAGDVAPEIVAREAAKLNKILSATAGEPGLVYDWGIAEKALLGVPDGLDPVLVENGSQLARLKEIATKQWPDLLPRLGLFQPEGAVAQNGAKSAPSVWHEPAFEALGVEEAIEEALADKIDLPSGGWISITPTPAMTVIDVNMGSALSGMSAAEAKLTVNMEATLAIAYHMQFQDLAGLIVVDYIDMTGKGHALALMRLIEETMREDSVPVQHTGISMFGLVEFTRKRSGLTLRDRFQRPARTTERPTATALGLIRRAVRTAAADTTPGPLVISAPKAVIDWISEKPGLMETLSGDCKRAVMLEEGKKPDAFIRAKTT